MLSVSRNQQVAPLHGFNDRLGADGPAHTIFSISDLSGMQTY